MNTSTYPQPQEAYAAEAIEPTRVVSEQKQEVADVVSINPSEKRGYLSVVKHGSLVVDLQEQNVKHFLGSGFTVKGGDLFFEDGLLIDGKVEADSLRVKGTLVVQPNAVISSDIECDRLINLGNIDCERVVVHETLIGWGGQIKVSEGVYARALEITSKCKLLGTSKDIDELSDAPESAK